MEWSIFEQENAFINVTMDRVGEIPYLRFVPKEYTGVLPTIIYYHGWRSNKDFKRFQAMSIASFGYQVIVPDALYHGERDMIDFDDPDSSNKYIWEIIQRSIDESDMLLKHIIENLDVDHKRVGIIGSSMGAITAGGIFSKNTDLKCLAGFNGAFAWHEAIEMNILPSGDRYKDKIEQYDLQLNIDRIRDRAVLILHGNDDTSVTIEVQRRFLDKVKSSCSDKQSNLELIEFSNVNHRVTTSMLENLITWLNDNL